MLRSLENKTLSNTTCSNKTSFSKLPFFLGITSPWAFILFMATSLVVIILIWLFSCGFLLNIPFVNCFSQDTLGFILGYVWGFFFVSWVALIELAPNVAYFTTFCKTLQIHITVAPVLYALHGLFFLALISWCLFLYKGMLARTDGQTKIYIKISAILMLSLLIALIIGFLFGDVIVTLCQDLPGPGSKKSWFNWCFGITPATEASVREVVGNVVTIAHHADLEAVKRCGELSGERAETCWQIMKHYKACMHLVNLEILRIPSTPGVPAGFQSGIATVTENILTPVAQVALEGACRGAVESLTELGNR